MYKFLQSKKGFTIVELMSVLVLISFGFFALFNLFNLAFRAFNKSMERYEKQETVKLVAQYLQAGGSGMSGATKVELYDNVNVVPTEVDQVNNYIYLDPTDKLLYLKIAGESTAEKLTTIPLYVCFDLIPYEEVGNKGVVTERKDRSRAIRGRISALEENTTLTVNDGVIVPPDSDNIYYSLDVAYHFPNMVENDNLYINQTLEKINETTIGFVQAESVVNDVVYGTKNENAIVIKYVTDLTVSGDQLMNESNFNLYCFIATASYGVNNGEGVVGLLCDFRDKVLLTNPLGEAFVKAYYKLSPPIADIIAESEPLRAAVRVALKPLVVVAVNALDEDVARQSAPWFAAFMLCGAGSTAMLIKISKRRKKAQKAEN